MEDVFNQSNNGIGFIHDTQPQSFYDAFNNFIFAPESKVFEKLISKYYFIQMTKDVPGDIMELGVFKGSGMAAWLKTLRSMGINNKKVLGFDIFDQEGLVPTIISKDASLMKSLFKDRKFDSKGYENILMQTLYQMGYSNFQIIRGNVLDSIPKFIENKPGFRASLINFDMDTEEPTDFCIQKLWNHLTPGGVMIFDEYAIEEWSESNAVDKFVLENKLKLHRTKYDTPTAYIIK